MSAVFGIGELSRERFFDLCVTSAARFGRDVRRSDTRALAVFEDGAEVSLDGPYAHYVTLDAEKRSALIEHLGREGLGAWRSPQEVPAAGSLGDPSRLEDGTPRSLAAEDVPLATIVDRVLPRLRPASFIDRVELSEGPVACDEVLPADLYLTLAVPQADGRSATLGEKWLRRWDVSFDELRSRAFDNLDHRAQGAPLEALSPGLWIGPWDDSFAAGHLFSGAMRVCEQPVVAVPTADTLLVANAENASALGAMMTLMEGLEGSDDWLTPEMMVPSNGGALFSLQVFEPEATTELAGRLRRRRVSNWLRGFAEQQTFLQRQLGDRGHAAGAEIDLTNDSELVTRALWTQGVDAWLPDVDRVHLLSVGPNDTSSRYVVASMADLKRLDGVLERSNMKLPRFRTLRYPTAVEIDAIALPVMSDPGCASVSDVGWRP